MFFLEKSAHVLALLLQRNLVPAKDRKVSHLLAPLLTLSNTAQDALICLSPDVYRCVTGGAPS